MECLSVSIEWCMVLHNIEQSFSSGTHAKRTEYTRLISLGLNNNQTCKFTSNVPKDLSRVNVYSFLVSTLNNP